MKNLCSFLFLLFILNPFFNIQAQESYNEETTTVADSSKTTVQITQLYTKFFELETQNKVIVTEIDSTVLGLKGSVDKISGTIDAITTEMDSTLTGVKSNVAEISSSILSMQNLQKDVDEAVGKSLTQLETLNEQQQEMQDAQTANMKRELDDRCHKVIETANFIKTANVSLNTLVLSNALTDYLNKVSDLNNPTNEDLGFSITDKVVELVEQDIFKDEKKLGSKKKGKFLNVLGSLINNPITQTLSLGMSSVVTSLTGIDQIVTSTAMSTDDVSVDELQVFRTKLRQYVVHYQALSHANTQFEHKLTGINMRIEALQQLMKNFVGERIQTLYNQNFTDEEWTLTQLIQKQYDVRNLEKRVEELIADKTDEEKVEYEALLTDARLIYPPYALTQTRFIFDELDALSKEYILGLQEYQTNLESVLNKAKMFGDAAKIDKKIEALRGQLEVVDKALLDAVNIEDVKAQFFALSKIEE